MNSFEKLSKLSPLPIVDLNNQTMPQGGVLIKLPESCVKNYSKGEACKEHYNLLAKQGSLNAEKLVQCPYGFASIAFSTEDSNLALTGFIPYPRIGGDKERIMAKRHNDARVVSDTLPNMISALKATMQQLRTLVEEIVQKHSMALHEMRKLNRAVKQMAERFCQRESPSDPDAADRDIVNIWKTSELMSKQFDIIEILANESLAELPLNTTSQPYRIFDKCVRAYIKPQDRKRPALRAPSGYSPRIAACDKTFPIIPTVLIENALKYSLPESEIVISIDPDGANCVVTVTNLSSGQMLLDDSVFLKGYRASSDKDGSGNGLYLAQLIAKQHGTKITVQSRLFSPNSILHTFRIPFRVLR